MFGRTAGGDTMAAATDVFAAPAEFNMGRVIARIFEVLGPNCGRFFLLASLTEAPPMVVRWLMFRSFPAGTNPLVALWANFPGIVLIALLTIVLTCVLQAAVVHGTVATLNGKSASFGQCLATAIGSFPKLFVISIFASFGILGGMLLLIVPGIILGLMWSVIVPACMVEQKTIGESFSRSAALTKGHRWAIFGILVIYLVLATAVGLAVRPLAGLHILPTGPEGIPTGAIYWTVLTVIRIIGTTITAIGTASIYYELRTIKEGATSEQLAAVFA
jgi:hypothetical protein